MIRAMIQQALTSKRLRRMARAMKSRAKNTTLAVPFARLKSPIALYSSAMIVPRSQAPTKT
jgi:hypothetical protein